VSEAQSADDGALTGISSPPRSVRPVSADVHGALSAIMSPSQLAAAMAATYQHSETAAQYEIGDWTERETEASAQLLTFTRVDSHRRAELMDQVAAQPYFCIY